jgi:GNAT superfamily N-acetyltransferase
VSEVVIRRLAASDEAAWRSLWAGYLDFYRASVESEATQALWSDLLTGEGEVRGYVAARPGEPPLGLVHYLFHRSTWSTKPTCYLQDLYVDREQRGGGAAKALMDAVFADAATHGAFRVYWMTQEFNAPARSLYDTVGARSSFIVYRKAL